MVTKAMLTDDIEQKVKCIYAKRHFPFGSPLLYPGLETGKEPGSV